MSNLERGEQKCEDIAAKLEHWIREWETKAQQLTMVESGAEQHIIGGETMVADELESAALRDEMMTITHVITSLEVEQVHAQRMVMLA
jgi:DNA repair exonuclease SbcCD ATPase subunit